MAAVSGRKLRLKPSTFIMRPVRGYVAPKARGLHHIVDTAGGVEVDAAVEAEGEFVDVEAAGGAAYIGEQPYVVGRGYGGEIRREGREHMRKSAGAKSPVRLSPRGSDGPAAMSPMPRTPEKPTSVPAGVSSGLAGSAQGH